MFEHAAGLTNGVLQVSSEIRMTYNPEKEVGKGGYMVYSAMIDYISKRGTVSPKLEERVITVK